MYIVLRKETERRQKGDRKEIGVELETADELQKETKGCYYYLFKTETVSAAAVSFVSFSLLSPFFVL